jgi:hypothetical protein
MEPDKKVRWLTYLKSPKLDDGEPADTDLREIEFKKNQYGPSGDSIMLRYHLDRGLFLPIPGVTTLDRAAGEMKADHVFLDLLRRFAVACRNVSDRPGPTYAPILFAREEEAKQIGLRKPLRPQCAGCSRRRRSRTSNTASRHDPATASPAKPERKNSANRNPPRLEAQRMTGCMRLLAP